MNAAFIFLGGGLGAVCRWLVSGYFTSDSNFPTGTLVVNLLGCFLIGVLSYYAIKGHSVVYMLGIVGFLGGFTTFSSYGYDLMRMLESGLTKNFMLYFLTSNVVGILLVYVGYKVANNFIK